MISFKPKFTLNSVFLAKNQYKDVLLAFDKLKKSKINLNKEEITIFYPGSGNDIFKPLLLLDSLADFKKANIILADQMLNPETIAETFLALTNSKKFKEFENYHRFSFKNKEINIFYFECDIFNLDLPKFDIYFERAFQLFRKDSLTFTQKIINNLKKDGLLISDFIDFKKDNLEELKIPEELKKIGFYKNFGILRKS